MSTKSFSSNKFGLSDLSTLKENYINFKKEEASPIHPQNYILKIDDVRANMVNWLSFLCAKLNFSDQTLFRSVSLFDQYISRITFEEVLTFTQEHINLITIACLSLSTKLEEINCNYISFLNDKVLNAPNCQIYTNKDLTKMELKILKTLKFKTIYSTPLDFVDIYIEIYKNLYFNFDNMQFIDEIKRLTINLMKNNIINVMFLTHSSSEFASLCFIQALNQVKINYKANMKQIEKSIFKFTSKFSNIF